MKEQRPYRKGTARVAFRAQREDIARAIEAGETGAMIWERLFGSQSPPPMTYRHFNKLVAREIHGRTDGKGRAATTRLPASVSAPGATVAQPASPVATVASPSPESTQEPAAQKPRNPPPGSSAWRELHGIPEPDREERPAFVPREPDLERFFLGRKRDQADR